MKKYLSKAVDATIGALVRKYAGAKNAHWMGPQVNTTSNANEEINTSWSAVAGRVQQMVRDFPVFDSAVTAIQSFEVGTGFPLQAKPRKADGSIDRDFARRIEAAWDSWSTKKECDVAGKMTFATMLSLASRQDSELGDILIAKSYSTRRGRSNPLQLQMIESTRLDETLSTTKKSNRHIFMGVEYDTRTSEAKAYHITEPDNSGMIINKSRRFRAADIIHAYHIDTPGQLRGISRFASVIIFSLIVKDYMTAELNNVQMSSKWLGWITTPQTQRRGETATTSTSISKIQRALSNATIEQLEQGEELKINNTTRSAEPFTIFTKTTLRMVCAAMGTQYEIVTGDYDGLNYTVLRGKRNDYSVMLKVRQQHLIDNVASPIYRDFLKVGALAGSFGPLPADFNERFDDYARHKFIPPGMKMVDPLKETKSNDMAIKSGLLSPQDALLAQGKDPETVLDEIKDWQDLKQEKGIIFADDATALAEVIALDSSTDDKTTNKGNQNG